MIQRDQPAIRYGIIGTGRIARDFASDLNHASGAALHSVLSRDISSARQFAATHGATASLTSMDDFLGDPSLDAVYIATPNSAHLPQALACIRAGKPVIVEKPLAITAAAASAISEEAAKYGVPVMEGMWTRFLPAIMRAKEIIGSGQIGEVKAVNADLAFAHDYAPDSRLYSKALGGGAALDLGVYLLSLSLHLFGEPVTASGAWQSAPSGVDEALQFRLTYAGFEAKLSASIARTGGNVFEITGSNGVLRIEAPFIAGTRLRLLRGLAARSALTRPVIGHASGLMHKLASRLPLPGQTGIALPYPGHGLQFEASSFAQLVRTRQLQSTIAPLSDSISVLRIIEKVLAGEPAPALTP